MIRVIVWILWLICLIVMCIVQSKKVLLTPQFGFIAGFIPQAVFLLLFIDKWSVNFSNVTMFVLIGGVTLFFVVSAGSAWFYMKLHGVSDKTLGNAGSIMREPIHLNSSVLLIFLFFQLIVFFTSVYYINMLVPGGTLFEKVAAMTVTQKFGDLEDKFSFPFLLNQCRSLCFSSGYVLSYLLLHSYILKYKNNRKLLWLNCTCWLISMLLYGNRGPFIEFAIASVAQGYIIWGKSKGWSRSIKIGTVVKLLVFGIVMVLALYWTMDLFGRTTTLSMFDYIGSYISSPVKILDMFIREGKFGSEISNSVTFNSLLGSLGKWFGIEEWIRNPDYKFRSVNGYFLGNVQTVFYCYLHDGGYLGVIILTTLMAIISQNSFMRAAYKKKWDSFSLNIIIYSYIFQTLPLAFFSDRFYLRIFSVTMLKFLLSIWLLKVLFTRIKFRNVTIRVKRHENRV